MNYIFDLYGTLIDIWTDEERCELWQGIALFLGQSKADATSVREKYLSLCKEKHKGASHELNLLEVFEDLLSFYGCDKSLAQDLATEFRRLSMVRLKRFYGVKTMLAKLGKQGRVYLVSNAQSCFTINELKSTGLFDLFDGILISSDVGVKKPATEIFEIAFEKFGISAENSIYVGNDMRDDVLGATGAGMRTLYIKTPQSGSYPDLDLPLPTFVVKNHRQMSKKLLELKG